LKDFDGGRSRHKRATPNSSMTSSAGSPLSGIPHFEA
jgi:hypothetical protein